jgi:hypothetical protein
MLTRQSESKRAGFGFKLLWKESIYSDLYNDFVDKSLICHSQSPDRRDQLIQGDQKVSVHLMITIHKVTSNVQSVPRQSPDIY